MRLKIIASCQQTSRVTCTVLVAGYLYIWVTQITVRIRIWSCIVSDINVVSATECWVVTTVTVNGTVRYFYIKGKWFQSIAVLKREYETVGRICVGTAWIWNKKVLLMKILESIFGWRRKFRKIPTIEFSHFHVFSKILWKYIPREALFYSFCPIKFAQLFLLEIIEPFPDRKHC